MKSIYLLKEDFKNFPIGEFPYDKNHSAMGEYHFVQYPGYYGKWYDPVCNYRYNGQGASWVITEYCGKHYMEQMRLHNTEPHRTFPTLETGDRFWKDYDIEASVRMFNTKWGNAGIGFCAQNSLNMLVFMFEDKQVKLVYRHKENVEELESKAFDYNSDDTYILNVSVNGSHVECYVNGTKYIDIDTVYAVQGGKAAITATIPAAFGYINVNVDEDTDAGIKADREAYKNKCKEAQSRYPHMKLVKKFNIGLFGGQTVGRVVLCNAVTGEMTDYKVEDVPTWVDKVYSAELLIDLYDYNGSLKHGFINSILSQRDCLKTTDGYNYIALEDDVWVYTGITSVGQDNSNVGFVLMNQRTMETRYYEVSGAEEYSAMDSAKGRVQNLGYKATFPLLINVSGQPTYFMALKDDAGLVKCYAMLNIEKYQNVAIGDSVLQCESNYIQLLKDNGIVDKSTQEITNTESVTGVISKIMPVVADGNTHMYIMLDGHNDIYDVNAADNIDIIRYEAGMNIKLEYIKAGNVNTVTSIIRNTDGMGVSYKAVVPDNAVICY